MNLGITLEWILTFNGMVSVPDSNRDLTQDGKLPILPPFIPTTPPRYPRPTAPSTAPSTKGGHSEND